jgi:hypothetical protein
VSLRYIVGSEGVGVRRLRVGDRALDLTPLTNPHRRPGVSVRVDDLTAALDGDTDLIVETF